MYRNERGQEIIKILSSEGYTTVKRLSTLLYTSESSIRRDLTLLERQGVVTRSYGGVELSKKNADIIPFATRAHHNVYAKKKIAKKACRLINDGNIIFLDQSSSAFYVASELQQKSNITVVTNNIEIIGLLSDSDIEVISSGGRLSKANRNCLLGEDAHRIFTEIRADLAFFSAKSLSADGVIYDCVREEVCIRNTMLANSEKKVFLCASEKINTLSGYKQCTLRDVDYLITETDQFQGLNELEKLVTIIK